MAYGSNSSKAVAKPAFDVWQVYASKQAVGENATEDAYCESNGT